VPRSLDPLLRFAAAGVRGDPTALRVAARAARRARWPRLAIEEVALMLMLYAGYPAALEAFRSLAVAWPGRPRRSREAGPPRWRRHGATLCRRVYGPVYPRLLATVRGFHPDLAAWMEEQGYGRVLSRPGLSLVGRELVTIAALTAGGWERQLVSHLLGAERVGASRPEIARALRLGGGARGMSGRAWKTAFGNASSLGTSNLSLRGARS
jgi:4-carboxymuconolactone decarboxylase